MSSIIIYSLYILHVQTSSSCTFFFLIILFIIVKDFKFCIINYSEIISEKAFRLIEIQIQYVFDIKNYVFDINIAFNGNEKAINVNCKWQFVCQFYYMIKFFYLCI